MLHGDDAMWSLIGWLIAWFRERGRPRPRLNPDLEDKWDQDRGI